MRQKKGYWFFLMVKSAITSRAPKAITGIVPDFCGVVGTTFDKPAETVLVAPAFTEVVVS